MEIIGKPRGALISFKFEHYSVPYGIYFQPVPTVYRRLNN